MKRIKVERFGSTFISTKKRWSIILERRSKISYTLNTWIDNSNYLILLQFRHYNLDKSFNCGFYNVYSRNGLKSKNKSHKITVYTLYMC